MDFSILSRREWSAGVPLIYVQGKYKPLTIKTLKELKKQGSDEWIHTVFSTIRGFLEELEDPKTEVNAGLIKEYTVNLKKISKEFKNEFEGQALNLEGYLTKFENIQKHKITEEDLSKFMLKLEGDLQIALRKGGVSPELREMITVYLQQKPTSFEEIENSLKKLVAVAKLTKKDVAALEKEVQSLGGYLRDLDRRIVLSPKTPDILGGILFAALVGLFLVLLNAGGDFALLAIGVWVLLCIFAYFVIKAKLVSKYGLSGF